MTKERTGVMRPGFVRAVAEQGFLPAVQKTQRVTSGRQRLLQGGYVVSQAAMAATLATGIIGAVGSDWSTQQALLTSLQSQSSVYANINNAVGVYMTLNYMALTDLGKVPADCENINYHTGSLAANPVPTGCGATVSYTTRDADGNPVAASLAVANLVQPTLQELKTLQLLDASVPELPVVPVNPSVATAAAAPGSSTPLMANQYAIQISRSLNASGVNLNSLLLNVQPYQLGQQQLNQLVRLSNGQAGSSGEPDRNTATSALNPRFDLRAANGDWSKVNPIQQTVTDSTGHVTQIGVPGIVAWRNGYDASAAMQMMRRDGSLQPTSDWDFGGHNLNHVNQLGAASLQTSGDAHFGGNVQVTGLITGLADLVIQGTTSLKGALQVAGLATFNGPVQFNQDASVAAGKTLTVGNPASAAGSTQIQDGTLQTGQILTSAIRSNANGTLLGAAGGLGVNMGSACGTAYALAQQNGTGKLLICQTGLWTSLFNDFVTPVDPHAPCSPEDAMSILANGSVVVCRKGAWVTPAVGLVGSSCPTQGAIASGITSPDHIATLLVCNGGVWSPNIYARPKTVLAAVGDSCSVDEVNAIARNNASPTSGIVMCTAKSDGGASWQAPYLQLNQDHVDYSEFLEFSFWWEAYHFPGAGDPSNWGQRIRPWDWTRSSGGDQSITLRHFKGTDASGKPVLVGTNTVPVPLIYQDFYRLGRPLCTGDACVSGGNYFYLEFGPENGNALTGAGCGASEYNPESGPRGFWPPNPVPPPVCGNDWTGLFDQGPNGKFPGLTSIRGHDSWGQPERTDLVWLEPNRFQFRFYRSGGDDPGYTVRLYRNVHRTYNVLQ